VGTTLAKSAAGWSDRARPPHAVGRGFTLTDLLVSIAVVTVLIGLLLPSLSKVHEASHRIVCASNLRQNGLALHLYANDNDSWLPESSFAVGNGDDWDSDPLYVRLDGRTRGYNVMFWDGMGHLISQAYLSDPRVFYCPSHTDQIEFEQYAEEYAGAPGEILSNYQYRGIGPNGELRLDMIVDSAAIVSDGFRSLTEINHDSGMNVLRAGMSVGWFSDTSNTMQDIAMSMGDSDDDGWTDGWDFLDHPPQQSGWWLFD